MDGIDFYILAGGRSSRFGGDKSRALLDGRPLIARVAAKVGERARSVTVVSEAAEKFADLGLRTIGDVQPGLGPLGGLETALKDLPRDAAWLGLVSCDLVKLEAGWIDGLLDHRREGARAVAFRDAHGWQPLVALYHRAVLEVVEARLRAEARSMRGLLDPVDAVAVALPRDWPAVLQVNTREDLARYEEGERR